MLAPLVAALGALVFGWFCVRLSGVYLAMLTLAFAQIVWSVVFQWDDFTGGSNGLIGVWPAEWLADKRAYYYLTLALVRRRRAGCCGACCSRPSATRCAPGATRRCAPRRSASTCKRVQWVGLRRSPALFAGLAGALFAFSKGSISPETPARRQARSTAW